MVNDEKSFLGSARTHPAEAMFSLPSSSSYGHCVSAGGIIKTKKLRLAPKSASLADGPRFRS